MSETAAGDDPQLSAEEKEFVVRVNKADSRLTVHSEIGSVTRALLGRDDFIEQERREVDGKPVAVTGTLPLGVLKIQQNARKHGKFSTMVSRHE